MFTTREAEDFRWVGNTKVEAGNSFAEWLRQNLEWVSVGVEPLVVTEILDVNFEIIDFNGQVIISYLCEDCVTNECESNGEAHETFVDNCRFKQQETVSQTR